MVSIPPPPPPMPVEEKVKARPPETPTVSKGKPLSRSPSQNDLIVEELKDVLEIFHERRNKLEGLRKTPDVRIHPNSTPAEVQSWLKTKEFDIV